MPWPGLVCLLLSVTAVVLLRGRSRWVACLVLFLSLGFLSAAFSFHPMLPPEGDVRVTGVIGDEVRSGSNHQWKAPLYQVTVDGKAMQGGAYWTFYAEELPDDLLPGQWISLKARLYHPGGQENPGGYDFREALLRDHITVGLFGLSELTVSRPPFFSPVGLAASLRHQLSGRLVTILGEEAGAYATALILGSRSMLPLEDREAFSRLGIAHVLSVSGFHVGILVGMIACVFRLLGLPQRVPRPKQSDSHL